MNNENIKEILKNIGTGEIPADVHKIAQETSNNFSSSLKQAKQPKQHILLEQIMKSRITKLAAAAVIIVAVVLSISVFDKSIGTAYAIEQTIEANRGLWFIHLKCEPSTHGHVDEIWAQFDDNRQLTNLRMNFLDTVDGPKDVVWHEGKAEVWFKANKGIAVLKEKNILAQLKMSYKSFDPKLIGEQLYYVQADEKKQIEIQESRSKDESITITWTRNGFRTVYKVDPETKLLQQFETYELKDGDYKFLGRTRYLDYNQPFDPGIFVLNPPAEVMRADQTTQEVGMAKGDLSEEEIAVEMTRQFLEALIDQDYTKVGKLIANIPAEWVKQQPFGKTKYIRIVSIGKPVPYTKTGSLRVPCKVEIEKDGKITVQSIAPCIRQVYGQPERRQIIDVL